VDFLDGDAEKEDADGDFEDGGASDVEEFAESTSSAGRLGGWMGGSRGGGTNPKGQ